MRASLLAFVLMASQAMAQGFAGLGSTAEGFAIPQRGTMLTFPRDHGAHPDYRIEWWYLTANLRGEDGRDYGAQWTLFRSALAPVPPPKDTVWDSNQIWMGHAAVTTPDAHLFAERLGRVAAGVTAAPFAAWIDDWRMAGADFDDLTLTARGEAFSYDLSLSTSGPLVLHGDAGYSVKSASGQASYYYSQPSYDVSGVLRLPDGDMPVTGNAWLDREWSSQPLDGDQTGWDWFSLSFDDGSKLMGFVLRGTDVFTSGTWIGADGDATALPPGAFQAKAVETSDVDGRAVPIRWAVTLPDRGIDVAVEALNPQSWMGTRVPYWEGPVAVSGSHSGRGYLEMTGY